MLTEKVNKAVDWLRDFLSEKPMQVYLPLYSTMREINGVPVESFYVAGYGGFGFNYVDAYHVCGRRLNLPYDILAMTPNSLGANRAAVVKVINTERDPADVKMDVQGLPAKIVDYVLQRLNIPLQK